MTPIGVFDSGYGGLTVLRALTASLPEYDFVYLGDNARAPYGNRSYETIYNYTLQAVTKLFELGCELVILACNTASAKALRTIQQNDLPRIAPHKRVLGVIRPSVEAIGEYSKNNHIGILGTHGTIHSQSYPLEIQKLHKQLEVSQEACPMWVSLVENNEHNDVGADFFVHKNLTNLFLKDPQIDTLMLGCTHYPLLIDKIRKYCPPNVQILTQGEIVSKKLIDYLHRHPEIDRLCTRNGVRKFYTTESTDIFSTYAEQFCSQKIKAIHLDL